MAGFGGRRKTSALFRRLILSVICCLAGAALCLTGGCAAAGATAATSDAAAVSETTVTDVPAETTAAADRPAGSSGTLRIWWTTRATLNPLLETSRSGLAVQDLVFRGLYRIQADQTAGPDLALNMAVWDSGLLAVIVLKDNLVFHDGQPVTIEDVAACFQFILDPANQSPYAAGLAAVSSVRVIDAKAIELTLSSPDPWLAYALTFPIIPAASLNAGAMDPVPGTGRYRMVSYDSESGLSLQLVAAGTDDPGLRAIVVREYRDQADAMRAFEDDQLDLVFLDTDAYSRYALRSSLRLGACTGNELLFLSYNTRAGSQLASADRLLAVKKLVHAAALVNTTAASWGEATDLGLPSGSWLPEGSPAAYKDLLDRLGDAAWNPDWPPLTLIVPAGDLRRIKLAEIIADLLKKAGATCSISRLAADVFWPAVKTGAYDLALLSATLAAAPYPGWLFQNPRPSVFSSLDLVNDGGAGLDGYADWQGQLMALLPDSHAETVGTPAFDPALPAALAETAARSPWSALMLLSEGLAYGDRVSGQCRPECFHPYVDIEELWVWSGQ